MPSLSEQFNDLSNPSNDQKIVLIVGGILILSIIYFGFIHSSVQRWRKKRQQTLKKIKQKEIEQANIIAMKDFYFIIETSTQPIQGPYEKAVIISMLNQNKIKLSTFIRKGIEDQNFRPLKDFPELVADVKDFI